MSDSVGFENVLPGEGRAGEALAGLFNMFRSELVFFGVTLVSEPPLPTARLCLDGDNFSLRGLSLVSGILLVGRDEVDGTDMRDLEGRRSLDTGCDKKSLLACPEDDREGDREYEETLDGVRDGDRIGLAPLKKLDCLFTEAGEGGILDSVSIVRSDRVRPRASSAASTSSSSTTGLASSAICV